MILIFLNLPILVPWPNTSSVLENIAYVLENNVYFDVLETVCRYFFRSVSFIVLLMSRNCLLIFHLIYPLLKIGWCHLQLLLLIFQRLFFILPLAVSCIFKLCC